MIARLVVALCAALPVAALAFSSSASGNVSTFGAFTATAGNVAPYTVSTASDGRVLVSSASRIPLAGGGSFPINVTGAVPRANAAAAIARFFLKGSGVIGVLGLGVAAYELAQELGFTVDNSSGSTVAQKPKAGACAVAPCFEYRGTATSGGQSFLSTYRTTREAAAAEAVANLAASFGRTTCTPGTTEAFSTTAVLLTPVGTTSFNWRRTTRTTNCSNNTFSDFSSDFIGQIASRSRTPDTVLTEPATIAEIQAAIEAQNVWNPNSKLGAALKDAIEAGEPVAVPTPVVTGPASVPGASSTTVDSATGQTTVVQQTINNTYNGPTVTTTATTTTTVTNTATGQPVSQATTTQTPVVDLPVSPETETPPFVMPCGVPGTLPCAVAVDETGMAVPTDIKTDQADDAFDEWDNFVTNIADVLPEFPTINWNFALPTACGVIPLAAFAPVITEIDVCQFQPMFHQLMSVVWSLGALFGAISLFMRASLSS